MLLKRIWVAVFLALPVSLAAAASIVYFFLQLISPCVGWGGGSFYASARAGHGCKQIMVDSRTRTQAALTITAVSGVILAAAMLGIWGVVRGRPPLVNIAGTVMLLEIIPTIFSVAPLALLAGAGFLVIASRMKPIQPASLLVL